MSLAATAFAAIDFESAGVRRGETEVPVQIGIAQMRGTEIFFAESFVSYIASDQPVAWSAQKVHGINDADIAGAPRMVDLWPQIKGGLDQRWLVAHGAATEKRFLRAFPFHGFGPWVDTLKLSRAFSPSLKSYALGDLIAHFQLEDELRVLHGGFRWHDALSDSLAALILLRHIIVQAGLLEEPAEILLRADDSLYHRLKAR